MLVSLYNKNNKSKGNIIVNIYELFTEIGSKSLQEHFDNFPYSFSKSNRNKLEDAFDIKVFDLVMKAYKIRINYHSYRTDDNTKSEYSKFGDDGLVPFTDVELELFNSLDWGKLPHVLNAHIYDVIWLCNHNHEDARIAIEGYYESYHEWFDMNNWAPCVDYISRAIELAAKLGINNKKEEYLNDVYNAIVKLNGDDPSFLSISLIELLLNQNYQGDFSTLIPYTDKLIAKNVGSLSTANTLEQAYYAKAALYIKLKDTKAADNTYVKYAENLIQEAEKFVKAPNSENIIENRNWFMAKDNIKKAIDLFQNHGASEKADDAQKRLIEIQRESIKHIKMQGHKFDTSDLHKKFIAKYENHNVRDLIWDVVFSFGFQNKKRIRDDVTKKGFSSTLFSTEMLGSEGQTEFYLPPLKLTDENNILMHMYNRAREYESIEGQTLGRWFIQSFIKQNLQESDLDFIFENNPIIPKGQEKDIQRGIYYGLTGHMSNALDKLAPKMENLIRNLAETCGDRMSYYDPQEGNQQKKVISQVFNSKQLNECIDENILFTFDGLLQQKAGSNIRNRIGHGLNSEAECSAGDCIYFVMIVLKFCALFCKDYKDEIEKRRHNEE